jgi:hypothetical protein
MGDGLTDSEITRILFKKYLNFPTTHHGKRFYDETDFENNTNLFHESIMTDMPTKIPNFIDAPDSKVVELLTSNNSGFNVDASWVETKIHAASNIYENVSKFEYDTGDSSILRLNKIKLDYLGNNSAAFGCTDKSGNNVLKNLIPNSYSAYPGYSLSLNYIDAHLTELTPTNWLSMRPDTLKWGAPLFDPANGTVVFYDVSAAKPNQVFDPSINTTDAPTFYLTATKYVGAMGISGGTGGTADNDHVEFNTVSGISPLTALNTTLSGEIVSTTAGGTANNDHVEFNTVSGISSLTALNTTLSGEIVATTAGDTANNDHVEFNTVSGISSLTALNTTLSGEIMSVTASSSGGTADNDHVEFAAVPGIYTLSSLNTTLSGEIVATTAGGTANNDHVEFNTVSGIGSLTSLNTTLSGEIVATTAGGTANNDHVEFNTVPSITSLSSLNTTLSGEIVATTAEGTADNDHVEFTAVPSITSLTALDTNTMSTTHIDGDMTISTKLGIGNGTTTPGFSLDVHDVGTNNLSEINGYYLDENSGVTSASSMTSSITIRAQNDILSGGKIIAESDRRIKKDMVDLSKEDSLELVRNLMPKKYHYIDSTQKGGELVYGYVAQEVKEVLPSAVQHIRGAIPSIFEMAQVSRSKNNKGTMLTFRHYDTQNLDPSCEVLKLVDARNNDRLVHIAKVVDARRLEIEEQVEEGQIFVYGEEVQDFHVLSKDYINVVAVSALQQMDSQVTQLKEENRALRGELNEIKKILQNNGMI